MHNRLRQTQSCYPGSQKRNIYHKIVVFKNGILAGSSNIDAIAEKPTSALPQSQGAHFYSARLQSGNGTLNDLSFPGQVQEMKLPLKGHWAQLCVCVRAREGGGDWKADTFMQHTHVRAHKHTRMHAYTHTYIFMPHAHRHTCVHTHNTTVTGVLFFTNLSWSYSSSSTPILATMLITGNLILSST